MDAWNEIDGHLARVRHLEADRSQIFVEDRTGQLGYYTTDQAFDVDVGDLVLIDAEQNSIRGCPDRRGSSATVLT